MAKHHAIRAAQEDLALLGLGGKVIDVELRPVGRVIVRLRDGTNLTVDRWMAVKLRTLLQHRYPRHRGTLEEASTQGTYRRFEIMAAVLLALLAAFLASM